MHYDFHIAHEHQSDVRGPVELTFLVKIETQHLVHHYSCKTVMHHEHISLRCLDVLLTTGVRYHLQTGCH